MMVLKLDLEESAEIEGMVGTLKESETEEILFEQTEEILFEFGEMLGSTSSSISPKEKVSESFGSVVSELHRAVEGVRVRVRDMEVV